MSKAFFSLHEANELVQKIKPKVQRIVQLSDELQLIDNTKIEFDNESIENYMLEVELNKSFHQKNLEVYTLLGEIIKEGAIVRELESMEIDLFSKFDGRDIVFCWKPSEDKILFWHFPHEQGSKRRSIKEIEKKYFEELKKLM